MQHDQSPSQFNSSKFNSDLNQTPAFILSTKTYFRPEHDTASEAETVKEWTLSEYRLTSNKVGRWKDSSQKMKRVEVEHT